MSHPAPSKPTTRADLPDPTPSASGNLDAPQASPADRLFEATLPAEIRGRYTRTRRLDEFRWIGLRRFRMHWRIHVFLDDGTLDDSWCFDTIGKALAVIEDWDGEGEPVGWDRHPSSGRVRDPATGQVWTMGQGPLEM